MTSLNAAWAIQELDRFIEMTVEKSVNESGIVSLEIVASVEEITQQLPVVEMIVRRVLPTGIISSLAFLSSAAGEWKQVRPLCLRAKGIIKALSQR